MYLQVIKLEGDQMQVSYVKNTHTPGVFKWPDTPDISWTKEKDIVKKLGKPLMHSIRMGYITFEGL